MEHILNLEQVKKYYGGNSGNTPVAILNSLYQRRKEFAMLRSVGLDWKGLDRLLHIEGFFLGVKPLVIGLPILFLIAAVLM